MDYDDDAYEAMLYGGAGAASGGAGGSSLQVKEMLRMQLVDKDYYNDFGACLDESDMSVAHQLPKGAGAATAAAKK